MRCVRGWLMPLYAASVHVFIKVCAAKSGIVVQYYYIYRYVVCLYICFSPSLQGRTMPQVVCILVWCMKTVAILLPTQMEDAATGAAMPGHLNPRSWSCRSPTYFTQCVMSWRAASTDARSPEAHACDMQHVALTPAAADMRDKLALQ